jgi:hypothetical protein
MLRLAAPGGRIVLCDGLASDDPSKAQAFNTRGEHGLAADSSRSLRLRGGLEAA